MFDPSVKEHLQSMLTRLQYAQGTEWRDLAVEIRGLLLSVDRREYRQEACQFFDMVEAMNPPAPQPTPQQKEVDDLQEQLRHFQNRNF